MPGREEIEKEGIEEDGKARESSESGVDDAEVLEAVPHCGNLMSEKVEQGQCEIEKTLCGDEQKGLVLLSPIGKDEGYGKDKFENRGNKQNLVLDICKGRTAQNGGCRETDGCHISPEHVQQPEETSDEGE